MVKFTEVTYWSFPYADILVVYLLLDGCLNLCVWCLDDMAHHHMIRNSMQNNMLLSMFLTNFVQIDVNGQFFWNTNLVQEFEIYRYMCLVKNYIHLMLYKYVIIAGCNVIDNLISKWCCEPNLLFNIIRLALVRTAVNQKSELKRYFIIHTCIQTHPYITGMYNKANKYTVSYLCQINPSPWKPHYVCIMYKRYLYIMSN